MRSKRALAGIAFAALAAIPLTAVPAQAGALTSCINSEFWNQNLASCPGVFTSCVNSEFWNQNLLSCV
ncbi:MAG TPA: hypothetical protein VG318_02820 [Actinomycetota bacterium]|nr:hypothetical protein [Actinomycetota bacterium]